MPDRRLRLTIRRVNPEELAVGQTAEITALLEADNLESGIVRVEVESRCLVLLSQDAIPMDAGSYSRELEVSVGAIESTEDLPSGTAAVTITAQAGTIPQVAQVFIRVRPANRN